MADGIWHLHDETTRHRHFCRGLTSAMPDQRKHADQIRKSNGFLELGLELTGTKGIDGGLRWSVVSLGGKRESSRKATHTVTVKLTPHRPSGGGIDVSDVE